jgi:glucose/arabinose dehydrogenase
MKPIAYSSAALLLAALLVCSACDSATKSPAGSQPAQSPLVSQPAQTNTSQQTYRAEIAAEGLDVPWDMAFVPDGRIFITERTGTVRVMEQGKLLSEPVLALKSAGAAFVNKGESGLLGIAADPNFNSNGFLYVYHTYEDKGNMRNRVIRLAVKNNKAAIDKVIIDGIPGQSNHDGGRIRIGPDGMLYITTGDAQETKLSQDSASLAGKILRLTLDGAIPADNPIKGSPVYSMGHRNPQGLAWHPVTKKLYASEHGQSAHDEINLIEPGANYGWPLIQGDETTPKSGSSASAAAKLRTPLIHSSNETWAPSGMTFVQQGPWQGQLLVANLSGSQLLKLTLQEGDPTRFSKVEKLYKNEWGRLRSISEGTEGTLYILTNNRDGRGSPKSGDDKLIRLIPATAGK